MYNNCTKCGGEVTDRDKFCQGCGTALKTINNAAENQGFNGSANESYSSQNGFGTPINSQSNGFATPSSNQQSGFSGMNNGNANIYGGFGNPVGEQGYNQGGFGNSQNAGPAGFSNSGYNYGYPQISSQDELMQKYAFMSSFFAPTDQKYLEQLSNYLEGKRCGFNWASAFFSAAWLAYRKMSLKSLLYSLLIFAMIVIVSTVTILVVFSSSIELLLFDSFMNEALITYMPISIAAVSLISFLYFGFCGYKIYFKRLSALFGQYRNVDRGYMFTLHSKYGGTSTQNVVVFFVIFFIINFIGS